MHICRNYVVGTFPDNLIRLHEKEIGRLQPLRA